jgi:threonyl-tRNA synthetase
MVHRALWGSVERFFGILIEHYAGAFPLWLAPVQVAVLPVSEKVATYAANVAAELKAAGIRVYLDDRNEKLGAKIRDSEMQKIPFMAVVGGKEAEAGAVSVRHHGKGDLGARPVVQFVADLQAEIVARTVPAVAAEKAAS